MAVVVAAIKKIVIVMDATNNTTDFHWSALEVQMRAYAHEAHVPIIVDEGLALLEQIIRIQRPSKILEIGTAIGFSAIRMHQVCNSQIYTIERNQDMICLAKKNIQASGFAAQIHLIEQDALEAFDSVKNKKFDLIFIDAAKAQYTKFFEIYTPLLTNRGIVITDNMSFHGLLDPKEYENQSRSVKGLIRKLLSYRKFLLDHDNYDTTIFEIGDGIAVSVKKDEYANHK